MSPDQPLALPALRPVYEAFAAAAAELPALPDALHAELWVSQQLGVLESAAPDEAAFTRAVNDLAAHLATVRTPGAATFQAVLTALLQPPPSTRAEPDPALPEWLAMVGAVAPGEAWLIQDGTLGADQISLEFRYPDGALHALLARPGELLVIGDVRGMMARLRQGVQQEECAILRLAPADAAARVRAIVEARPAPTPGPYAALLTFVRHRLSRLP